MEQLTPEQFKALAKEKCPRQYEYLEMIESSLNDERARMALGHQNDVLLEQKRYDHAKNQIIEIIHQSNLSPLK